VAPLIEGLTFGAFLADKAFDAGWIVAAATQRGAEVCIPQRPYWKTPRPFNRDLYKHRHKVENFFCKLKDFRRIALRSDKTDTSFIAMINLCAALINAKLYLNKP
jgi:transposase